MMPCGDREASGFINGRIRSCRAVAQRRPTSLAERAEASQLNRLDRCSERVDASRMQRPSFRSAISKARDHRSAPEVILR